MDNSFDDIKHAALLFQNGRLSGKIDDEELIYVHNQIISPLKQNDINGAWHQWWDELGIPNEGYNDRAEAYIRSVLPLTEAEDMNSLWLELWTSLLP